MIRSLQSVRATARRQPAVLAIGSPNTCESGAQLMMSRRAFDRLTIHIYFSDRRRIAD